MKTNHGTSIGLALLGAGLIAWMFTADWRYAVAGVIAFVVAGVIGAGIATRGRATNLRPVGCPAHGLRAVDLNGPEEMCGECRVLGADGEPLGWADGRPTEATS